eukprot:TRINITY_DN16_c0_g1_i1.p1 TRINITY_DN16_c0_g1~~TRINITY_DN16_c0_g1_i1.p1  ORF type:complete len:338 (-),score=67.19 TRINITY_DN16_c0_g1_i1:360-1373(-)
MGDVLARPVTDKNPFRAQNERLSVGGSSMQGWRRGMEDAHQAVLDLDADNPGWSYFAVFDGHCGKGTAVYSGENLHRTLLETPAWRAQRDIRTALRDAYLKIDMKLRTDLATQQDGSGSTAVCCLVGPYRSPDMPPGASGSKRALYVANAGDSRGVLCRGGRAIPLSVDHKPNVETERSRIVAAGGFVAMGRVNGNLALSRALGDFDFKGNGGLPPERQAVSPEPEVEVTELTPEDEFVVLACDGIWDVMTNEQVVEAVRQMIQVDNLPLDDICDVIFDRCLAPAAPGLGCDNMTMMIVNLKPPGGGVASTTASSGTASGSPAPAAGSAPGAGGSEK